MTDSTINRVAIIGAGISGIVSAAHLLAAGLEVTVFERSQAAGGVWLFDKRVPIEVQYPNRRPSDVGWYSQDNRSENEQRTLVHAPPGPCYESLTNNVSTPLLRTKLNAWPEGTPHYVNHNVLKEYIQDTSKKTGVDDVTIYGALVKQVYKEDQNWHVHWTTLNEESGTGNIVEHQKSAKFDAVVVGSGHYHTPLIPDITGLAEAKAKWPAKITHSKSFRSSKGLEQKNVLLVGGGVSSVDIAREISPVAKHVYQSTRNGAFDIPATALPKGTFRVEEVIKFELISSEPSPDEHSPIIAHLKSGQTLRDIDLVILCTGYQMVLPFLPQYNETDATASYASNSFIVTDGAQFHNLHRDVFYIPDPTLAFVGVPFYTATFTLFEFQAIAVAAFFSGISQLPSTESLRDEYESRVRERGHGRSFHSLKGEEEAYVKSLVEWVNAGRAHRGLPLIEGHTSSWVEAKKGQIEKLHLLWQGLPQSSSESEALVKRPAEVEVIA
ncbi:uncharacterized protein N7443_000174 [Penicillium atrosanguineum]|uniref:uncharacterized protein n=1 Tax=Penicillium atrosanguineum TaxID=1132637 RepID=UPI0023A0BD5E|nr:uncharacterized protein N7443_000174 [Penicillium atrosanguineum]KAJ5313290.1 hypothetical protein N7443_000174 [Penicillium atrosanguineum]